MATQLGAESYRNLIQFKSIKQICNSIRVRLLVANKILERLCTTFLLIVDKFTSILAKLTNLQMLLLQAWNRIAQIDQQELVPYVYQEKEVGENISSLQFNVGICAH